MTETDETFEVHANDDMGRSELVISKILALLMEWGIQQSDLQFAELDLGPEYAPFFFACVEWLEMEGVIRVGKYDRFMGDIANGVVSHPVLTSYGMRLLGMGLSIGGGEEQKLADTVKEVSSGHASYAKAGNFAGGVLGAFIKSMG